MRKLALVLVAVLLLVMVGACGETASKPQKMSSLNEDHYLYNLFVDFSAKSKTNYEFFLDTVLESLDTSGTFVKQPDKEGYPFLYKYNKFVNIEGLNGTVLAGRMWNDDLLYIRFYLEDNPGYDNVDAILDKLTPLGEEAFGAGWDSELNCISITMDDDFYMLAMLGMYKDGFALIALNRSPPLPPP